MATKLIVEIGQKIMVGFKGTQPNDPEVQELSHLIEQGKIGGVIFFAYNLTDPTQVKTLTNHFKSLKAPYPLLLAIDQEGGKVQRLSQKNGFEDFMSAKKASTLSPSDRQAHYVQMAHMVKEAGFNTVLGPVMDLEYNPKNLSKVMNPVIGKLERSYSHDPDTVVKCADSFIGGMHSHRLITALKHFPGHGLAAGDTHKGLVDITASHQGVELEPYEKYMRAHPGKIDMVMTAHLMHRGYDSIYPATLSPQILKTMLRNKGYDGVIISDCLHMGAIRDHFTLSQIVLQATQASVDIMLFSRNAAASINGGQRQGNDTLSHFVNQIHDILAKGIAEGALSSAVIKASSQRIERMKTRLK